MDPDALGTFLRDLFIPGTSVAEKIIRPAAVYLFLVVLLRIGGRRELGQMNAFDLVVLLTISNAVQNAIIGDDNSLLGGFIGGATLVLLNLVVVRFLYRHAGIERRLEGDAVTLVKDGRLLRRRLERERITVDELQAAIRRQGVRGVEDCAEVILESSGTISVIERTPTPDEAATGQLLARLNRIEALLADGRLGSSPPREPARDDGPPSGAT